MSDEDGCEGFRAHSPVTRIVDGLRVAGEGVREYCHNVIALLLKADGSGEAGDALDLR